MHAEKPLKRFFIINFSIIISFCVCLALWFSWLEWNYQILNFMQFKTPIPITAKQSLKQYLVSMEKRDYEIAYGYLSQESKARHSFKEFVNFLKDGMTVFNTHHFWQAYKKDNRIMLGLSLYQDPATWGFELTNENKWKIVWEKGRPYFPYPENFACGISD